MTPPINSARADLAPACPTPTDAAALARIEKEIAAAIVAGVSIDKLSTEWERLDAGARTCRGK